MAKLTTLKPMMRRLPPTMAYAPHGGAKRDRFRDGQQDRMWYHSRRWRKLRMTVLVRDRFTCQMCGKLEGDTSKLVADHKTPHRGREALFWDEANIQCLCKVCHDSDKRRQDLAYVG